MNASAARTSQLGPPARPIKWFLDSGVGTGEPAAELKALLPYAAAFTLLYGLSVTAGFAISTVRTDAVAIWPAVGLLSAVLAATSRRTWAVWILSAMAGRVLFELLIIQERSLLAPVLFSLVNIVEALILALLMQKPLMHSYNQGRPLYLWITLMLVAIIATNVGGILGATTIQILKLEVQSYWDAWRVWAAGDFVGIILVTPLAVWLMLPQVRIRRDIAGWPENLAMAAALFFVLAVAIYFAPRSASAYAGAANVGLAVSLGLPMLWAAVRADFPILAALQLALALAIVTTASYGLGPFAHDVADYLPALAAMQIFLIVTVLVVTTVCFAILERERAQQDSDLYQRFSDMVVMLTNKLIGATIETFDRVITDSLQVICEFAQADRCVLMQIAENKEAVTATHRWMSEDTDKASPEFAQTNLRNLPWLYQQIRKHGYIALNNFDQRLPAGAEELEAVRDVVPGTATVIYVGLFSDEQLVGAIGFGYLKEDVRWSRATISLMFLVGQLFANILQRKKVEKDLELYRDKLRSLAKDITITEERARRRTAIDLHDGIGQNLAVARMKVGQLLAQLDDEMPDLIQLRNLIDDTLRGTRYIIADLSPSILYELGLVPALHALAERFALANNTDCQVEETGVAWKPENDLRIALYRAVQECLNNVARHAQADTTSIRILWDTDKVDIEISDDGVGFDADEHTRPLPHATGFGLFSIRESVMQFGGTFTIESASGLGTTVRLCTPRTSGKKSG